MAKQIIDNLDPGTLDGDSLFQAAEKINANFTEIYNTLGDGNTIAPGGIANVSNGIITAIGAGQFIGRRIESTTSSITITNGTGLAGNPSIDLTNSGVIAGTYPEHGFTVTAQGIITGITTPTFLTDAQTASTNAQTSAANAAASATSAANDVSTIGTSLTDAQTAATNAAASATTASTAATTATTQATNASTSATNAATSETNANTSATNAATSETNAGTSATTASNAATTATNAANSIGTSVTDAQTAATNAQNAYDSFDDRYLGAKTSAPSVDNDGDALITGALYFDSVADEMRVYNGSSWAAAGSAINGTTSRNSYTATANQTTFASVYDVGFVDVYLNGLKLMPADFTATSGTNIVLASGAAANDTVDIVAYGAFAVANTYTQADSNARFAQLSNNLSDLANAATARTNLGLHAVASSGDYNDLTNKPTISTTASNVAGGTANGILYQSATDTTAHLAAGVSGYILQTNGTGSAPTWVPKSSVASPTGAATVMKLSI